MADNILISVYSLANKNNGFFKSEKQAQFLIKELVNAGGSFIEWFYFGYTGKEKHSRTVTVLWDDKGITEIKTIADRSGKESVKFTRKSDKEFAEFKAEKIAQYNKELLDLIEAFKENLQGEQNKVDQIKSDNAKLLEMAKDAMVKLNKLDMLPEALKSFEAMEKIQIEKHLAQIAHWENSIAELTARLK